MKILLISLFDEWCLGLRSLSAVLRAEGHEVTLAYLQSNPEMHGSAGEGDPDGFHVPPGSVPGADLRALDDLAARERPGLIGLSFTSNFHGLAAEVTRRLKAVLEAPVIWGGVDATSSPEEAILHADMVCIGEGEGAIIDLTRALSEGADVSAIPNLWVRDGETIHRNPVRPLIQDLDSLPFSDFDPDGKYWISGGKARHAAIPPGSHLETNFPVMSTRGCPYACTFCCNAKYRDLYGGKDYVRMRSVSHLCAEVRAYVDRNPHINSIEFFDDVWGTRREWVREFCEVWPREIGMPFWCYTYPSFCRPDLVEAIKSAGASFIVMGIQSGSQRTLREVYKRNSPNQKVIDAARMIMDAGIPLVLDLIGSNPLETEEDHRETLELMLSLPKGFVLQEINPLTFYRNFPITEIAAARGFSPPLVRGRNVMLAEQTPEFRFWNALISLTQFPEIAADSIRAMADDPCLRERPEIVEDLLRSLIEATYLPGTRMLRRTRERNIEEGSHALRAENARLRSELARLNGSRAVSLYFRIKSLFGRGPRPRNGAANGNGHATGNGGGNGNGRAAIPAMREGRPLSAASDMATTSVFARDR